MRAFELIRRKRDGGALTRAEIEYLVTGCADGSLPDCQVGAFAMAVFFRGMSAEETAALTEAMLRSGAVLDLSGISVPKVDKHSTGGVGDKVTLALAPAVAACGVAVPMLSGRGLGHTGGTLDKLESIPGMRFDLSLVEIHRVVAGVGACITGTTADIVPADRRLYAVRDVTATVDCIPLIVASIMSKKLAAGIDGLVLDVKYGSGAVMKDPVGAEALAHALTDLGARTGTRVVARMSSMEQPLGRAVGNAMELWEALDVLEGGGPPDVALLTVELGAEMLVLGDAAADIEDGRRRIRETLASGAAREKFGEIVAAQGGDRLVLDDRSRLPTAPSRVEVVSPRAGHVAAVDADSVGLAATELGGGRAAPGDAIDPRVGVEVLARIGDRVAAGQPLFVLHAADQGVAAASALLEGAITIGDEPVAAPPLLGNRIGA